MAALATIVDAANFGYVLDPVEGPKLLDRASARVRAYTGQTISRVVDDVVQVPVIRRRAQLPERPADKPTVVKFGAIQFLEGTAWYWDPIHQTICNVDPWINSANFTGWWLDCEQYITVTYSHGYAVIPETLKEIVCAIAFRLANSSGGMEGGVRSEAVGGVSVTYSAESLDAASNLLPGEKSAIDKVIGRRTTATIPLGRWH